MTSISRKRCTPDSEGEPHLEQPSPKKRRLEPTLPQTPPPEKDLQPKLAMSVAFDTHPKELLLRSVAETLKYVGFHGASQEALEAFASRVDTYMEHFLDKVNLSKLTARRTDPIPTDFAFALAECHIPLASIEPHTRAPISAPKVHLELADPPPKTLDPKAAARLFGDELGGGKDKQSKAFIPKALPDFPSKHTYKSTPQEMVRETDPRKIREQAAKIARQGEESLRKFIKISKSMEEKRQRAITLSPRAKMRQQLYEQVLSDFAKDAPSGNEVEHDDRCVIVNSEKAYWRQPLSKKRKVQQVPTIITSAEL